MGQGVLFTIKMVMVSYGISPQSPPFPTKLSQRGASKRYLPDCMIISLLPTSVISGTTRDVSSGYLQWTLQIG